MKYLYVFQNMNCILTMIQLKTCVQNTLISVFKTDTIYSIKFTYLKLSINELSNFSFSEQLVKFEFQFFFYNTTSPRLINIISTITFVNYFVINFRVSAALRQERCPRRRAHVPAIRLRITKYIYEYMTSIVRRAKYQ